jgi:hypothetical protein
MDQSDQPAPQPSRPALPSAFALFGPSVEALKVNVGTIILLVLAPYLLMIVLLALLFAVFMAFNASTGTTNVALDIVLGLLAVGVYVAVIAFMVILSVGLIAAALKSAAGQRLSFSQAFVVGKHFGWRYLGLGLLVGLLILGGLILLIVPGIFMIKRYYLSSYYLIDHNLGIREAMRRSAADAKEFSGAIWGLLGVTILLSLAGVVPIIGGAISLVLGVMYLCAPAIRYLQIKQAKAHGHHAPAASIPAPAAS